MWFRKSLQEQIDLVKRESLIRKLTAKSANIGYMAVAVDMNYKEAAEYFLKEHVKEQIKNMVG